MGKNFVYIFILTVAGIMIFLSCKKEPSCEGCREWNKPPIAVAGPDRVITLPTDSVLLDGSSSSDPDGKISVWRWTKISGPASFNIIRQSDSITLVKLLVTGTYQFELKVKDNGALYANDTIQIIVIDPTPVANAGPDQAIYLPTNTTTLDGSGSIDPDSNISNYQWTIVSASSSFNIVNANAGQTQVTNLAEGFYQFELKVTDSAGLFSRDTVIVRVFKPLVIKTLCSPYFGTPNSQVQLTTQVYSIGLNGQVMPITNGTFQWTQVSGPNNANFDIPQPFSDLLYKTTVTNLIEGAYNFKLAVTYNSQVFYDTSTVTVHVIEDTLSGKEFIYEGTWGFYCCDVVEYASATTPIHPELFYDNPNLNMEVSIKLEGSSIWIPVPNQQNSTGGVYCYVVPCNRYLEIFTFGSVSFLDGQPIFIRVRFL